MIKLFEEYKDTSMDDYYQEISKEEYEDISIEFEEDIIFFEEKEVDILCNLFPQNDFVSPCQKKYKFYYSLSLKDKKYEDFEHIRGFVYKLPDEWYSISIDLPNEKIRRYYKCDQLEGLIKCLKDIYDKII